MTQQSNRLWLISLSMCICWAILLAILTPSIERWLDMDDFSSSWLRYLLMFLPFIYLPHKLPIWLSHISQRTIFIINTICTTGLLCLLAISLAKFIK